MRVLITGATGYIGKKLVERLKLENHEIYAVVRSSSDITEIKEKVVDIIYGMPYENLQKVITMIKPELYINVAGFYCGKHSEQEIYKLLDGNIILPTFVMDAAVNAGCKYIIHTASVQQCYGGKYYSPINLYAATKQAFEDIVKYYTITKKINAITLQLFDTYGVDDNRNKVFNLVRRLKDGEELKMSLGKQKMYFCYIDDVIDAYIQALNLIQMKELGFNERYAVRGDQAIELKEFVEEYLKLVSKNVFLRWGEREYMEREIMDSTNIGCKLPKWNIKISYKEGIKKCAERDSRECL